jgi:hypothetical protein
MLPSGIAAFTLKVKFVSNVWASAAPAHTIVPHITAIACFVFIVLF